MTLTTKQQAIIAAIALAVAFAAGRWTLPAKIKTEIKTVEVEKKTEQVDTNMDKHKEVVVMEVVKPDGTKEVTTKTVEDVKAKTDTKEVVQDTKKSDTTKEVTYASSKVTVSAMGGVDFSKGLSAPPVIYGASVTKPILGPIAVGVWGLSNLTFGASIGLTF